MHAQCAVISFSARLVVLAELSHGHHKSASWNALVNYVLVRDRCQYYGRTGTFCFGTFSNSKILWKGRLWAWALLPDRCQHYGRTGTFCFGTFSNAKSCGRADCGRGRFSGMPQGLCRWDFCAHRSIEALVKRHFQCSHQSIPAGFGTQKMPHDQQCLMSR